MKVIQTLAFFTALFILPATAFSQVFVTRDSYGVPIITGGNLAEVSRAIGKAHAEDRLWQIFLQNIAANGRLSQYLGASSSSNPGDNLYLSSDIFQRQINPTEREVASQINQYLTEHTLLAFVNYVKGLNDHVDAVNSGQAPMPYELAAILGGAPVPHFTLFDNLRSVRLFLQSFSPTQIPKFQLNNLIALQTLSTAFGPSAGYAIFEDADPTTSQVRSLATIMHNKNPSPMSVPFSKEALHFLLKKPSLTAGSLLESKHLAPLESCTYSNICAIAKKIHAVKELHKNFAAGSGSNGQVIGPEKSASGNPLLRCAIQPNFNHPGDFYQVKVENSFFNGNFFIVPGIPFGIGMYNRFGFTVQTGHLPTNDFLFEPTSNVSSSREEVIQVKGEPDVSVTIYRSASGGWVIENPISSTFSSRMLTLRSAFINNFFQGLNIIGDLPYIHSVPEFFKKALQFSHISDIIGFSGQCADCEGNFGAFQATAWTKLPKEYDRRLPQGTVYPAPSNKVYGLKHSARPAMYDINNPQGYYSGWNNAFKQFAEATADTVYGIPLSRAYWLEDYFKTFTKIRLEDLKQTTYRQALANSVIAFKNAVPTAHADLFTPLFKKRFFQAIENQAAPTQDQLAALALLSDFEGNWYDGTEQDAYGSPAGTDDVSDKFILASAWLLNVAAEILNPYLGSTIFEVNPGTSGGAIHALPTYNVFGALNSLSNYQADLLARILKTAPDNTLIFPKWLDGVDVDNKIITGLDTALANLGGISNHAWGVGQRQTYAFKNAVLGEVATTKMFNSSGLYFVAEFSPNGIINVKSTLPLGESGLITGTPPGSPTFDPHNFDQLPFYQTFSLIPN